MYFALFRAALALSLLTLLAGCPPARDDADPAGADDAPIATDRLEFEKIAVGLPIHTLDYLGSTELSVAGAKEAGKVFFAVRGEQAGNFEVYERDLATLARRKVTQLDNLISGTLIADPGGETLIYARRRALERYIDNPAITQPAEVAVVYRLDAGNGSEQALFDFRDADWLPYRNASLSPQMSHSGKRVAALSFDFDESQLMMHLDEWLARAEKYTAERLALSPEERSAEEQELRSLYTQPHVRPHLADIELSSTGTITESDIAALRALRNEHDLPIWALLLWHEGESRAIPLVLPERYDRSMLSLVAVGDDAVLLAAQDADDGRNPRIQLLSVNADTGTVREGPAYAGLSSSLSLSPDESELILVYRPYDAGAGRLLTNTHLRRISLGGGEPTETDLGADYAERIDISMDGELLAGQVITDQNIYRVQPDGSRTLLLDLAGAIEGIFVNNDGSGIAYLENGILFALQAPEQPEQSADWATAERFVEYEAKATEFLTQLGFTLPDDVTSSWEEMRGLGLESANGALKVASRPGFPVLLNYNIESERFESLWFPAGYPFEHNIEAGSIDAPTAESRVRELLGRIGWLTEKAQLYQPGPNPLYDARTRSHVVVLRDGFNVSTPSGVQWAVNGEATVRLNQDTGRIEEMSLHALPKVERPRFELDEEGIEYSLRNKGQYPIPSNAPARFDIEGRGLIVARAKQPIRAPALLQLPGEPRMAWEVNGYIQPEEELIMQVWVDVENGDVLGELFFEPTGLVPAGTAQMAGGTP